MDTPKVPRCGAAVYVRALRAASAALECLPKDARPLIASSGLLPVEVVAIAAHEGVEVTSLIYIEESPPFAIDTACFDGFFVHSEKRPASAEEIARETEKRRAAGAFP